MSEKNNRQHLTLSDRIYIEQELQRQVSFKDIAEFVGVANPCRHRFNDEPHKQYCQSRFERADAV